MSYFIDPQGNYPRHVGDIKAEHIDWDENIDNLPNGWQVVLEGIIPEIPEGFGLNEVTPAQIDGVWVRQFELFEYEIEEEDTLVI
jgi:hypothetical protein